MNKPNIKPQATRMTQLNLLPDVKLKYLRTNRNKRLVVGVSIIVAIASVAITLLLVSIAYVLQKKNIDDLNKDISRYNTQLKDTPDLGKVLTVQNQLKALTGLHQDKAVAARLFDYLTQLTPAAASITQLDTDFVANTMTITGSANSLDVANTYIDTLKFTTYQTTGNDSGTKAFTGVVLSQFVRNTSGATFTVTLNFNPIIFNSASAVKLTIPRIISTRSATEQPADLFKSSTSTTSSTGQTTTGTPAATTNTTTGTR